jgi:23S rRNA pseudouridine2605 synthase
VTVKGYTDEALEKLKRPIVLDGYRIRPPKAQLISNREGTAQILVTIHDGRNRQVRRMCAAAGMQVQRLVRVAEGPLTLDDLPLGKWRHLTQSELTHLKKHLQF